MAVGRPITCVSLRLKIFPNTNTRIRDIDRFERRCAMSIPYGYCITLNGQVAIDQEKATIVRLIYRQYLSGMSLGEIADLLFQQGIPSPKGKETWTQSTLSRLLSDQRYIGHIVSFDEFFLVQGEKARRSNIDEYTNQRKATRYSSQSVLSGLLVCAECGRNYRRITRPSGEVVWRCASRVEHGKKFCQNSPSIPEEDIKEAICKELDIFTYDEVEVKTRLDTILVQSDGSLQIELHQREYFDLALN